MTDILNKRHPDAPNGHGDVNLNSSGTPGFDSILKARLSRRDVLKGSLGIAATAFVGGGLSGCLGSDGTTAIAATPAAAATGTLSFNFTSVAKSVADALSIPTGYTATVLYRLGDPLDTATPAYVNDGTDSAASYASRAGDHHDGMAYFGLNDGGTARDTANSTRGLLCMNHENITQLFLHTAAEVAAGLSTAGRVAAQIDKEVNAHGVSVIEVRVNGGAFQVNTASAYNRRYTATSSMDIYGPCRRDDLMITKYSPGGTETRGTLNNCANGATPWGTYLTCEENWAGYFKRPASSTLSAKAATAQNRYLGSGSTNGSYGWANPTGGDVSGIDLYDRWNVTPGTAANADYRNAANTMGWVVEIDPYSKTAVPRKRTAMGRFGHEGAWPGKVTAGQPLAFYMGDDARNEYIYKYVSAQNWSAADAAAGGLAIGDKYLDDGKLYVATFAADGTGQWIELTIANATIAGYASYAFADQADVLVNCRLAADAVGATPMDRPEWGGVHPVNGEIYFTLTNNSTRGSASGKAPDAANPRYYTDTKGGAGNVNGHVLRMKETDDNPAAATFTWDIYLFGAQAAVDSGGDDAYYQANVNLSALTAENDFSSPDGLWFSSVRPGLMWLQTDDGAYTDVTNCMMLAALPGSVGDGGTKSVLAKSVPKAGNIDVTTATRAGKAATDATLSRFLVGPKGCEITGITETPDGKTIFVNIQHPGENTGAANIGTPANYESHWPAADGAARPRSSTVVITKNDGGTVGA